MKTFSFVTTLFIGVMFLLATTANAQMHGSQDDKMPMIKPMMQSHMSSMANMMSEMAVFMQKGKMTPEQQFQCGAFMQRLSGMMQNIAADPQQENAEQRQLELQTLEKEWNYWRDEHEEH